MTTYNPDESALKEWRGPVDRDLWRDAADIRESGAKGAEIVWAAEKGNAGIGDLVWIRIKGEDEYQAVAEIIELRVGGQDHQYGLRFLPEFDVALRDNPLSYQDLQRQSHGFMRVTDRVRENDLSSWVRRNIER